MLDINQNKSHVRLVYGTALDNNAPCCNNCAVVTAPWCTRLVKRVFDTK